MIYNDNPKSIKEKEANENRLRQEAAADKINAEKRIEFEDERRKRVKAGDLKRKLDELKRELALAANKIQTLERELNKNKILERQKEEEIIKLRGETAGGNRQSEIKEKEEMISRRTAELEAAGKRLSGLARRSNESAEKETIEDRKISAEIAAKRSQLIALRDRIEEARNQIIELQKRLAKMEAEHTGLEQAIKAEENAYGRKVSGRRRKLAGEQGSAAELAAKEAVKIRLAELNKELEIIKKKSEEEKNDEERKLKSAEDDLKRLRTMMAEQMMMLEKDKEKIGALEHEYRALESELRILLS